MMMKRRKKPYPLPGSQPCREIAHHEGSGWQNVCQAMPYHTSRSKTLGHEVMPKSGKFRSSP